jgi:3-hydroxybutyryl-CoA dehydratase
LTELLEVFDHTPSRGLTIDDVVPGHGVYQRVCFGADLLAAYTALAHDRAPVHHDAGFARASGFTGPIVQGLALSTRFSRLIGMYLPGERAILESIDLKFRRPVYAGSELTFTAIVQRVFRPMRVVDIALSISAEDTTHVTGGCRCLIR